MQRRVLLHTAHCGTHPNVAQRRAHEGACHPKQEAPDKFDLSLIWSLFGSGGRLFGVPGSRGLYDSWSSAPQAVMGSGRQLMVVLTKVGASPAMASSGSEGDFYKPK